MGDHGMSDSSLLDRLAAEFAARASAGEAPSVEEYAAKYPGLADRIRNLFPALRYLGPPPPTTDVSEATQVRDPNATGPYASAAGSPGPDPTPDGSRYRMGDELARGGMGVVYRAEDQVLGREVAVKVLGPKLVGSDAARRFVVEAELTGWLQHPGIPPVHDLGTLPDGRPFLAMKLIRGKTLADKMKGRKSPAADRDEFLQHFEQVCLAVAFAHSRRVIHRDLKPQNVMVGAFGEVQVMDWGLAKSLAWAAGEDLDGAGGDDGWGDDPEERTRTGQVMGTPAYMPPEQARGLTDKVDERADVFALGGILCAILTGFAPYRGVDARDVWQKAADADLADAIERIDAVSGTGRFPGIAKKCLARRRTDRFAHAGEVAAAVHNARMTAEKVKRKVELEEATTTADHVSRRADRRSALALKLGLGGLVSGVVLSGFMGCYAVTSVESAREREEKYRQFAKSQREEFQSQLLPLTFAAAAGEVDAGTFEPGWDAAGRDRVTKQILKAADQLPPTERAFAFVVLAGLADANKDESHGDSQWTDAVRLFADGSKDPTAEARLAVAVVDRYTARRTPTKLDTLILSRVTKLLGRLRHTRHEEPLAGAVARAWQKVQTPAKK